MKTFIHEDFLLSNRTARRLYHEYAENKPIIDFHCHLSPAMIADDRQFKNITEAWLEGDHYKWRAMRTNGINEKYCTGKESDPDKFMKWAETVPNAVGNPLYHWTHLELARYFEIFDLLSPATANKIYEEASEKLQTKEFSTRNLLKKMNVEVVCTTDDPTDSLEYHKRLQGNFEILVLPAWRPDNVIKIDNPATFIAYIEKLSAASGIEIDSFEKLVEALDNRHEFFHSMGSRLSDHGLDRFFYAPYSASDAEHALKKLLKGKVLNSDEAELYKTAIMTELCKMNHKRGWTQQFHVGAIRNNNTRLFNLLGPDTGWDSIGFTQDTYKMSRFLDNLDMSNQLGRSILYNLNPADNEMMITMAGNFNDGTMPVKVSFGAAWWFLDQKTGIEKHLKDLASFGLLRRFIGMVTDSRSFLSYPRHEYFRRVLCNYVGTEVENGNIPDDESLLKPIIEGASYDNAKESFGFGK